MYLEIIIFSLKRLWDCRVSVFSLLCGYSLFVSVPQVRDLFLEHLGTPHVFLYAIAVVVFWFLQIFYSSSWVISRVRRPSASDSPGVGVHANSSSRLKRNIDTFLPWFLGFSAVATVLVGLYLTRHDILACYAIQSVDEVAACRGVAHEMDYDEEYLKTLAANSSLFEETLDSIQQINEIALFLLSISAIIFVIYASKSFFLKFLLSRNLHKYTGYLFVFMVNNGFRLFFVLFASALSILAIAWPFAVSETLGRATLLPIILGGWVPVLTYVSTISDRVKWPVLTSLFCLILVATTFSDRFHDVRTYKTAKWQNAKASEDAAEALYWKAVQAEEDAKDPRSKDEAKVLRTEAVQSNEKAKPLQRQSFLNDAIERWQIANQCVGHPESCPPVVLVATEGGASRSAFFTATVLGALLDKTRSDPKKYHDFQNVLFAASGVSGGALGLVTTRTALVEAQNGMPPCASTDPLWFGAHPRYNESPERDPTKSWRACLELLTAGDYLSAPFVGLTLRDHLSVPVTSNGEAAFHDRAVLLEQAIERHYNYIVHKTKSSCADGSDQRGLCASFGYLQQTGAEWLPLLMLNATSLNTGRPILISDLYTAVTSPDEGCHEELFPVAHNVFELYASDPYAQAENPADGAPCLYLYLDNAADIRLSTAAVLSARFPIVSPAGTFRYENEYRNVLTAQTVDGGYFDNSGIETLLRIIPELQKKKLNVIVLYLTNEPYYLRRTQIAGRPWFPRSSITSWKTQLREPQPGFWARAFPWFSEPLQTLYAARMGHAEQAADRLYSQENISVLPIRVMRSMWVVDHPNPNDSFCVNPPTKQRRNYVTLYQPLMNWYLSPVTQRVLDAQLCDSENESYLNRLLKKMEKSPSIDKN